MTRMLSTAIAVKILGGLTSIGKVAALFGTTEKRLHFSLYGSARPIYKSFDLPKRSGGMRRIDVPPPVLAHWQRILAALLRDAFVPKRGTHGFCLDRSIVTGADVHTGRREVLNVDLRDFFGTIHFGRVRGVFQSYPFGLDESVSAVLAQLCCWEGRLPQGAPTSPMVSNWVCRTLDSELGRLAGSSRCDYTRYADDITFTPRGTKLLPPAIVQRVSGTPAGVADDVAKIIESNGFAVNSEKVYVRGRRERQEVTGLVVNQRVNVPRMYVLRLRAALNNWDKNGYAAANAAWQQKYDSRRRFDGETPELRDVLRGRLAFLHQVRGAQDRLYVRYALDYSKVLYRDTGQWLRPVVLSPLQPVSEWRKLLTFGVWLVCVFDKAGNATMQGSAVHVAGFQLVTCYHVVEDAVADPTARIEVYCPLDGKAYPATVRAVSIPHDLAEIETSAPKTACFVSSPEPPKQHDPVTAAGYADWSTPSDGLRVVEGSVVEVRQLPALAGTMLLTDASIRPGMSGGALWNDFGQLVGIVRADGTHAAFPNGAVPIFYLSELTPLP